MLTLPIGFVYDLPPPATALGAALQKGIILENLTLRRYYFGKLNTQKVSDITHDCGAGINWCKSLDELCKTRAYRRMGHGARKLFPLKEAKKAVEQKWKGVA